MLTYFLESVFDNAEKYHNLPKILKEFLESKDDTLLTLGTHLNNSIRAPETQEIIRSKLETENCLEKILCNHCDYSKLLDEIKYIVFSPV